MKIRFLFLFCSILFIGAGCGSNSETVSNSNSQTTTKEETTNSNKTNTMDTEKITQQVEQENNKQNDAVDTTSALSIPVTDFSTYTTSSTGLQYKDITVGKGAEAAACDTVAVHYTGMLPDGTKFDSSLDRDQSFEFLLGSEMVIAGWDEGVEGMKVGGKRVLVIPPDLGYGESGAGSIIPPNATLHFEVELMELTKGLKDCNIKDPYSSTF